MAADQKPNTLPRAADPGSDIGQRSQSGVGDTDDLDARQLLEIVDGRQYRIVERIGLAIEVDILRPVAETDRGIVATRLEQQVHEGLVLKVRTVNDQSEVIAGHLNAPLFLRLRDEGTARRIASIARHGCRGFEALTRSTSGIRKDRALRIA